MTTDKAYAKIIENLAYGTAGMPVEEYGALWCLTEAEHGYSYGGTLFSVFELAELANGGRYIRVSPLIRGRILDFFNENDFNLFSYERIKAFLAGIGPALSKFGWSADSRASVFRLEYALEDPEKLNKSRIMDSSVMIRSPSAIPNISGSYDLSAEDHEYFCTVVGGEIVSLCGSSLPLRFLEYQTTADIGIATNEAHRRHGYAASNVAAMASRLLALDKVVKYSCRSNNLASQATACAVGFEHIANHYILFCNK